MGSTRSGFLLACLLAAACSGETSDDPGRTSSRDPRSGSDAGEPEPAADDELEPEPAPVVPEPAPDPEPPNVSVPVEPEPAAEPVAGPTDVDAGSEPAPEPTVEPEPVAEPVDPALPVLVYVGTSVPRIMNLRDGSVWAELTSSIVPVEGATPWSPDGSLLVDQRGGETVFLRRDAQSFVEDVAVPLAGLPARWLGEQGVLVGQETGLAIARPDGSSEVLTELGPIGSVAVSPDGSHVLFSTIIDGVFTMYHMSFDGSAWSEPRDLGVVGSSPALSQRWSSDERYLAFGIAGGDASGIHVFDAQTATVFRVTPEGAGYNPLYSFAGARNLLVLYAVVAEPELAVVNLDGDRAWQVLRTGGETTPAEWSPDGTMLLHGFDTSGELVPFASDGSPGKPIPFTAGYGCHPLWLTGSDFYFSCAGDGVLEHATVDGSSLLIETVREGVFPNFLRSPSGGCVVNYSTTEIALVSLLSGYEETLRVSVDVPLGFSFAGDGSGVAWTQSNSVAWQGFDESCQPGESALVGLAETPQLVALLP